MDWLGWIPDFSTLGLVVWGLLVVPVVGLGIPFIMTRVQVPRRLEFEEVADAELTDAQRRWLDGIGERLRGAGFEAAATFRAPNLPSTNLSRAYTSGVDGSVAVAMSIRDEREGSVLSDSLLEYNTEFGDGTFVSTRSSAVSDLFDLLPGYERHIHATRDPIALKRHHDRHCRPHQTAGARPVRADRLLGRMAEFHERWIAHQIAQGLLRIRDAQSCGATLKLAVRGVSAFFNPFGDRFSVLRLLAGVVVGAVAPVLVAQVVLLPGGLATLLLHGVHQVAPVSPDLAQVLVLAPLFLLAAGALGWIFESRAVVWAPMLASLAGWLTLPASTPDAAARAAWLVVLLGTSGLADRVSNWRHRRSALV